MRAPSIVPAPAPDPTPPRRVRVINDRTGQGLAQERQIHVRRQRVKTIQEPAATALLPNCP